MAMLGKRFQRTISMSQIGPGNNLHAEKAQAQNYYQQQQQEGELAEYQPANQWEILKSAEAMMMMMAKSGGGNSTIEDDPLLQERQAMLMAVAPTNKNAPHSAAPTSAPEHHMMSSTSTLIIPTHHFLDACFYCKRRLPPERDIFIYRGDAAFCTEECRHRQILNDEIHSRASKKGGGATSETAVAA